MLPLPACRRTRRPLPWLLALLLSSGVACAQTTPVFEDQTAALGIAPQNDAACWADFDNDGWTDLCAGGAVWKNNAGKGFTRIAEGLAPPWRPTTTTTASWTSSPGRRCRSSTTTARRSPDQAAGAAAASARRLLGRLNGDGFVDLYVGGYEDWDAGITYPHLLLMNEQGTGFRLA